jgi:tRNA A-37 threonylcarbamoyl transferase component Bud32/mono/diheme cytochrome c family protein
MDPKVNELLLRWREAREQGKVLVIDELCHDAPELQEQLRRCICIVEGMEHWLGMVNHDAEVPSPAMAGSPPTLADVSRNGEARAVPPNLKVPGYEILSVLDQGGMGVVYKARQVRLKRLVALKMIRSQLHVRPRQLDRFRVEVQAVAKLQHPNIVQIHEVGECDGHPFYSMELVEGGNLAQAIAGKPLPPRQAAELVATLAQAVHFVHQRGVVHRDLKPANVLLQAHPGVPGPAAGLGVPKITDFGLAKLLDSESGLSGPRHSTQSGMVLGTPSYMAPEQAEGKSKETAPQVDVYALGAILYEMLTGRPPFVGVTPLDTLLRVVSTAPVAPSVEQPQVRGDLETICLKCLEKDPRQRYPTAAALADDLHRFLAGQPISARPISWPGRLAKWARRRPEVAALLAFLVLALLGLVIVSAVRHHERREERMDAERLAPRVRQILYRYCYDCHGQDLQHREEDLDVLDYALLIDPARKHKLVVPGDVDESWLLVRIEDDTMPPVEEEEFPRLSRSEKADLEKWIAGGAPPFAPFGTDLLPSGNAVPSARAAEVKKIFQAKCKECHRGGNAAKGKGILILNHDLLVTKRKVIVPGKPDQSLLFQLLFSKDKKKAMPPPDQPQLTASEIETIRLWIDEGAPAFPRALAGKP